MNRGFRKIALVVALFASIPASTSRVSADDVTDAHVASDVPAAILVFPKVVVDTADPPATARGRVDTLIRISNSSNQPVSMKCFWVNANGHCSTSPSTICDPNLVPKDVRCDANAVCQPGWQETDFLVNITSRQPVAWLASRGAAGCDQGSPPGVPCFPLDSNGIPGGPNTNAGSRVNAVPEDPFVGELKCYAVDRNEVPKNLNVLRGEADIIRSNTGMVDAESYNAIGIPGLPGVNANNGDNALVLGGTSGAEYAGCPNILILDHFFEGARDPVSQQTVSTKLTLVPCSENFLTQSPVRTTAQFLVFNEFEQRFSTSKQVECFKESLLSLIDTRSPQSSIFSASVSGTLTGQTRIRGVADADRDHGHTLLGIAEECRSDGGGCAAFNLHFHGTRPQSDVILLP